MLKEFNLEINNALQVLQSGGVILYPTDTVWGIGCDATNKDAVEKIYKLKKRIESKSLIILLDDDEKLEQYIEKVPSIARILINNVEEPLTIIYDGAKNIAKNVLASDNTIAIRIIKHEFCKQLINRFGRPIVSTSANISGEKTPVVFSQINKNIIKKVDYIVNIEQDKISRMKPSKIIRLFENGQYNIIRE